ncbi:hypothetical protein [Propionicicella superfundia]|uniref:hypothetical protein n=1 Tax=Propionicicella superfundia TaxID=348582 RepID=UPI0004906B57|nr:hypothetical protein [Propionicicella superfundia]
MTTSASVAPLSSAHRAAATVGFGRLVAAEARKLVDTRSGFWLLIATGLVTLAVTAANVLLLAYAYTANAELAGRRVDLLTSAQSAAGVLTLFLTVLSILTITSEWGQRTVLTTFVLEPRRQRVLAAKLVVILTVTVLATVIAFPVAAGLMGLAHAIFGVGLDWSLQAGPVFGVVLVAVLGALMGAGFGLLMLNGPAAIVTSFLLPTVLAMTSLISFAWRPYADIDPWVNPTTAQSPLLLWEMGSQAWAHLAVTTLIWIGVPLAIGMWRWGRREAT